MSMAECERGCGKITSLQKVGSKTVLRWVHLEVDDDTIGHQARPRKAELEALADA